MILTAHLGHVLNGLDYRWDSVQKRYIRDSLSFKTTLDKQHTYVVICSEHQDDILKYIEENSKIIYKSPKAVNKTRGHGTKPRNTLIVFELYD